MATVRGHCAVVVVAFDCCGVVVFRSSACSARRPPLSSGLGGELEDRSPFARGFEVGKLGFSLEQRVPGELKASQQNK
ncbi:hypothetical protein Tsubulata_042420 [Turnera subulata]|uniref:Uncharacterized protein n=1 Tax=Turnera subulata TaxID=218843 RepID=A0A9Q0FCK2_9ROSI|nr:hypothetical protein Tsubulata_042420 [Turnera subulata]